ncbi:MAG TPA: hypothetical protein VH143_04195 [Kofleriaceae bacterium]|jgi:hypothetical protein|nr:hypothetical protein [Kofleriaceae bacterium]
MRTVAILLGLGLAACGAATNQPLLSGVPRVNPAGVAGVAAAAAAAITLASPGNAQQKPEDKINENTKPQKVDESVPSDVLDRLDEQQATTGSATGSATPPTIAKKKSKATTPRLPSPKEAVEETQPSAADHP